MKVYNTQTEIEADINNGELFVDDDVQFNCSFSVPANLRIAGNITALDITARNIDAWDIDAWDIDAENIDALNITAWDIDTENITALDITARDISFYAFCFAYKSLKCKSIIGRRKNAKYGCLDSDVIITGSSDNTKQV